MASMREVEATRPIRWAGTIACRREGARTIVAPMAAPQTASARPATYGFGAAARPRTASPSTAAVQVSAEPSAEGGGDRRPEQSSGGLRGEEQAEAVGLDAEAFVREEGEDGPDGGEGDVPDRRAER